MDRNNCLDRTFLVKQVGHEVKHFAFAVVEFSRNESAPFQVPLQDSALVRARVLIDFFAAKPHDQKNVYVKEFYEPSGRQHPAPPAGTYQ